MENERDKTIDDDEMKQAQPWMRPLLSANPAYIGWGSHQDGMSSRGDWWNSSKTYHSWHAFGPWVLDEFNECVNFYFSLEDEDSHTPRLTLSLWVLHPRKSCSRGILIERIEESDVPAVLDFLSIADMRNRERFNGIAQLLASAKPDFPV